MSKKDAAPTLGWVVVSHINTFIVRLCLFLIVCLIVAVSLLVVRLDADCYDQPRYTFSVLDYEADVMFSKACKL